ncbi:unnamed protein product [Penicillium discolor]
MKSVSPTSPSQPVSPGRAKHLERNRVAANKCRERKKREHKQIERRLTDETEKKDILLAQLNCLREEVWGLKNLIFQHAECQDLQINHQLARMTQTVLQSSPNQDPNSSMSTGVNPVGPGARNNDWAELPAIANDFAPYEPNGFVADSMFEHFINTDNGYT